MATKYRDLLARAAWTALQAALGVVTVEAFNLPLELSVVVAAALSSLKSWVATKVGDRDTVTFDGGMREDDEIVTDEPGEVPDLDV